MYNIKSSIGGMGGRRVPVDAATVTVRVDAGRASVRVEPLSFEVNGATYSVGHEPHSNGCTVQIVPEAIGRAVLLVAGASKSQEHPFPLWCIDRGTGDDENRMWGPFELRADAQARIGQLRADEVVGPLARVRRCRRVKASEILGSFGVEWIAEYWDERVGEGEGDYSSAPWGQWDDSMVDIDIEKTDAAIRALDDAIPIRAWVCEPDPEIDRADLVDFCQSLRPSAAEKLRSSDALGDSSAFLRAALELYDAGTVDHNGLWRSPADSLEADR